MTEHSLNELTPADCKYFRPTGAYWAGEDAQEYEMGPEDEPSEEEYYNAMHEEIRPEDEPPEEEYCDVPQEKIGPDNILAGDVQPPLSEYNMQDVPVSRQEAPGQWQETHDSIMYGVEQESQPIIGSIFKRAPDELYCEREVRDLPMNKRVIALRSPCGTGKTKAFCRYLQSIPEKGRCVVFVTHRKAISKKAAATLPVINGNFWFIYNDSKGLIDINNHPLIVIQYESLGRLIGYEENYSNIILVLDEFNSICHQMHGKFGNPMKAQQCFYDLTQKSKHVIAMDGYLDQERMDILERYTACQSYLIHNSFNSRANQVFNFTTEQNKAIAYIISSVKKGEHVIVPCMNKSLAEDIYTQAMASFGDSKKILLFTRDNPWSGEDINITWVQADLVIHTSTIDCGISFEVNDHFQLCVCFFDNCTGPTHETGAQMLSRSRDTSRFLICVRSAKYSHRDPTPNGVLADFKISGQARPLDQAFFGIQGLSYNCSSDWVSCNPYLSALVMTEVIKRRSLNSFKSSLLQLLYQDGAQISKNCMVFENQSTPVVSDTNIQIPENQNTLKERVVALEMHYKYRYDDGFRFDPDNKEEIKLYERAAKRSAYSNLCNLARLGVDFPSAIEQMRRDWTKAAAGFELCKHSGNFNQTLQLRGEVLVGVTGGCYDLDANETARDFIEAVLGFSDPFNLPDLTDKEISERLGCKPVKLKKGNKSDEKETPCVPPNKSRELLKLLNKWTVCRPEMHTPSSIPKEDQLTLVKVLNLVNHVLVIMFDLQYKRQGKAKKKTYKTKSTYLYTYSLQESHVFTRFKSDLSHEKGKPIIPAWALIGRGDLKESELLAVGDGLNHK